MAKEDGQRAVAARQQAVSTLRPLFPFLLVLFLTPLLLVIVVVVHSGYSAIQGGGGCAWAGLATGGGPIAKEDGRRTVAAGRQAVSSHRPPFRFLLLLF